MIDPITYGILCGIWGYLISEVLTNPGEILHWYGRIIERATWKKQENVFHYWIWKVTVGCAKCVAGNLGLIVCFFHSYSEAPVILGLAVFSAFVIQSKI